MSSDHTSSSIDGSVSDETDTSTQTTSGPAASRYRRDSVSNRAGLADGPARTASCDDAILLLERRRVTAHEWTSYDDRQNGTVTDDGTMSFFWRAHTLTVLVGFSLTLFYVAVIESNMGGDNVGSNNVRRGIMASALAFLLFGVTQTPDGPFNRPHPIVWRFVLCVSLLYEMALIFLLFQSPAEARDVLKHLDPGLGVPLPEKSYGGNCKIYDPEGHPEDPFYNLKDKLDEFVPTHFFGWWFKTLILRDWWFCTVLSVMFELLEYTLEHQLPNFSECWWDHWLLDVVICNGAGIYVGMKTLNYLSMKPYHWSGMWDIPGYRGKLVRAAAQFSPYSWMKFDWRPTASLKRWIATLALILIFLVAELNTFYLKYVLWLAPTHWLNLVRLVFFLLAGAVAMRETFQYLDDPRCKKFGRQSWIIAAIIVTESLLVCKFDWELVTKTLPRNVFIAWILALTTLLAYTVYKFFCIGARDRLIASAKKVADTGRRRRKSGKNIGCIGGTHAAPPLIGVKESVGHTDLLKALQRRKVKRPAEFSNGGAFS